MTIEDWHTLNLSIVVDKCGTPYPAVSWTRVKSSIRAVVRIDNELMRAY